MSRQASIAVSSPGKVLVAGGYLVVDRAYTGLAFGLSARIHVHIQDAQAANSNERLIVVKSSQFDNAEWRYSYDLNGMEGGGVVVVQDESSPSTRNKFVETVLRYTLTYIQTCSKTTTIRPSLITILADTAYYSHADTATRNLSASSSSPFLNFNVSLSNAHKTGLGSSAALVTSLASALLAYYLPSGSPATNLDSADGKRRAHNLAQLAHCSAQGKVGSGFDVAAAVYGSCEYKRFSPSVLDGLGAAGSPGFADKLVRLVDDEGATLWDTQIKDKATSGRMAAGLGLFMCDVDCGSETPGMVKQIFAWRASEKENADRIWSQLQRENEALATALLDEEWRQGSEGERKDFIRSKLKDCRALIREMSQRSGVPVEPPAQTHLLDACSSVPGVLGGVVPGAGGYDALVLVAEDTEETRTRLEQFLAGYKPEAQDNGPHIGKVKLLSVKQEMQGVRREVGNLYDGWV